MSEKKKEKKETEKKETKKSSDTDVILDSIKELTTQICELTKVINSMKETHDKWVRAGKF